MSSRSVNIIGGDSFQRRQQVTVDSIDNALVTIDEVHQNIHRGILYSVSHFELMLMSLNILNLSLTVTDPMHMLVSAAVGGNMSIALHSDITLNATPGGTEIFSHNRNKISTNVSDATFLIDPTIDDLGEITQEAFLPGGKGGNAIGSSNNSFGEWVLPAGDYAVRVTNLTGGTKALSLSLTYYHPAQNSEDE